MEKEERTLKKRSFCSEGEKMKKINLLLICIIFAFVSTSCSVKKNVREIRPVMEQPYWVLTFDSVAEIQEFVSLVYNEPNNEGYKKYLSRDYATVKRIADDISSTLQLPCVKEDAPLDYFCVTYANRHIIKDYQYIRSPFMEINCVVNGVRYLFIVYYNEEASDGTLEGNWCLENQGIGEEKFTLYAMERCLSASVPLGPKTFGVIVYTTRVGDVNFDYFEFVDIPQNLKSE